MSGDSLALLCLAVAQLVALVTLCARLAKGRHRLPPVEPRVDGVPGTSVSVVIPARNEAARIGPSLDGLRRQGAPLIEVIVVEGGSTDGTVSLIDAATALDPRIRRLAEPPRPRDSVGRPWAILAGCAAARGEWILVVDADVAPRDGMIGGAVAAARAHRLDAVSFAPRIVAPAAGARWLQPAFLTTLIYRFGPTGMDPDAERAIANGQCLLMRRDVLERAGGYGVAVSSYCDDISIVRHLAARGARVGFLDGRRLLDVVMYRTARETWRGWPASLHMRDATPTRWRWLDALFLVLVQGLPLPLLLALSIGGASLDASPWSLGVLAAVNGALLLVRVLLSVALAPSFARRGLAYWLSPLADPGVVTRLLEMMMRRPREWRGHPQPASASR